MADRMTVWPRWKESSLMDVRFEDKHLEALERDIACRTNWDHQIVRGFRKVMQIIRSAPDERTFYAMKSLHYEKMKGKLAQYRTLRLTDQWRLFVQLEAVDQRTRVVVVKIDDPHK
jgi:toxin HigB-1